MCVLLVMLELLVLLLVLRLLVEVGVERRLRLGLAPRRGRCGGLRLMGHAIPFSPSLRKYTCTYARPPGSSERLGAHRQ